MADSTKVNDLQEKLLKSMSIVNNRLLSSISYDKTITATITDDSYRDQGKYTVSDGTKTFVAYSAVTNYTKNTTVFITIPNGDWENQKMIIGKKTAENDTPFVFTQPFDTIFDETDNVVDSISSEVYSLLANGENKEVSIKSKEGDIIIPVSIAPDYTRLGLSVDFCSWVSNAVQGTYGLTIVLKYKSLKTTEETDKELFTDAWAFNTTEMYGNVYNFDTYYNQQKVFNISDLGEITGIQLKFFQEQDFIDSKGEKLSTTDDLGTELFANLFCKNIYICAGHDISAYKDDLVSIYTLDKSTYNKFQHGSTRNIKLRWVHVKDGTPVKMTDKFDEWLNEENAYHKIKWYRYEIGESAADDYCGVYWTELEKFENKPIINFAPETEWQQEKIKAIIFEDTNIVYRSNELVFENEEIVPSKSTIIYQNALGIVADDNTNGNYMFYGQNGSIKESEAANKERTLSLNFDPTGTNRKALSIKDCKNAKWYLPCKNTMFNWLNTNLKTNEDGTKYILEEREELPKYKISSTYAPGKNDNTITCEYTIEGRTYTGIKEFSFGKFGTMGTEQTLEINWVEPNVTAIDLENINKNYQVQVSVIDKEGKNLIDTSNTNSVKWSWYKTTDNYITITKSSDNPSICSLQPQKGLAHEQLYILQVEVGNLITYFSIPLKSGGCTHIEGTQDVYYQANGTPETYRNPYQLFNGNTEIITTKNNWSIISTDTSVKNKGRFDPTIDDNKRLQVLQVYVDNAPFYGVKCKINECQWTQPILVIQNNYPSSVINNWDGKTLQMDSDTGSILATALSAGSKDANNRFTGVMIGDWSNGKLDTEESISDRTGVYGMHEGALSYAFMDDGKAFIGKSGYGRINFDGNNATIYSSGYKNKTGMKIDLGGKDSTPYIDFQYGTSQILLKAEENGSEILLKHSASEYIKISSRSSSYPLQIGGNNFYVSWNGSIHARNGDFSGKITSEEGTIGGWKINETTLTSSNDSVTLNSNGTIKGAVIQAGKLSSNNSTDRIKLDGYLSVGDYGQLGYLTSNLSDRWWQTAGIGIMYTVENINSVVKATGSNAGFSFNGNSVYATKDTIQFGGDMGTIRISDTEPSLGTGSGWIAFNVPANRQKGIYARFA